ncbi:MAG: tRNA (adenosine(37)-N6)-dimethylallyltransferase MiaA [Rhodothermia bacterium]|nr:tRNA (adenosine(37)-N6)-dimethylallyltransferase MiaA [Rhodothermia bacterium]
MKAPIIQVIVGPTAVGKTAYAIEVALKNNGEVVSADSRQVFKELNIGTAKPSREELAAVPHHFIDEKSLVESFSAGIFAEEANVRLTEIIARGKNPILCGGSTLYVQALVQGLAEVPAVNPEVRTNLMAELEERGHLALYEELQQADPVFAQSLDPTKSQRLLRGLEVFRGTGKPISYFHQRQTKPTFEFEVTVLTRNRAVLYERINQRVEVMLKDGLLEEVQGLLVAGYSPEINALKTIGYQEPISYLAGEMSYERMVILLKQNTRHYAKRQITWFKRFSHHKTLDEQNNSA